MSRLTSSRALALAGLAAIPVAFAFLAPDRASPQATTSAAGPAAAAANAARPGASGAVAEGSLTTALLAPGDAGADPYFVEPRVPRAAGTPCVEVLARNLNFDEPGSAPPSFRWTPSGACAGPWAKIVLAVETTGGRDISAAVMRVEFDNTGDGGGAGPAPGGGVLFLGSPQQHDLVGTWRFERDVTEYAEALHRGMQVGYGIAQRDNYYHDFDPLAVVATSVKLIYYPASGATPAQRTADAMRALHSDDYLGVAGWTFEDLPRNIERAYLDVMARPLGQRVWYSCVPSATLEEFPQLNSRFGMGDYRPFIAGANLGCVQENGSYREVEVFIDGQLAGLAPVFPWLPSVIGPTTIDYPAPSVQALNVVPFRVDLTPFAALLNDGNPHAVLARVNASGGAVVTGQLLLYLDEGRSVVTGALTRNTLATQPGTPAITDTLVESGDTLAGDITTFLRREYNVDGYVDTSHGRIRSTVYQVSRFANTQSLRVVGDPTGLERGVPYYQDYAQKVRLSSTVDRVSRRIRGTTLLSEDKDYTTYPLAIDFANGGQVDWIEGLPAPLPDNGYGLYVHQARGMRAAHYRSGLGSRYESSLVDVFDGSRALRPATESTPATTFDWKSRRRYLFTDNRGSCYSAGLTTANGELQTRTRGTECAYGNGIRWYAHPDGAPEAMLWTVDP